MFVLCPIKKKANKTGWVGTTSPTKVIPLSATLATISIVDKLNTKSRVYIKAIYFFISFPKSKLPFKEIRLQNKKQ